MSGDLCPECRRAVDWDDYDDCPYCEADIKSEREARRSVLARRQVR